MNEFVTGAVTSLVHDVTHNKSGAPPGVGGGVYRRYSQCSRAIMVSSRFQRSIQVEWPAKTQETEFGVIRSRGKRRTVSSWSRPKKRQKLLQGAKLG